MKNLNKIIELNKEVDKLKKENEKLKKENESLKKKTLTIVDDVALQKIVVDNTFYDADDIPLTGCDNLTHLK
ncbi:MAG TPA: hypothetical protein DCM40_39780 [Maribacter sp.]|nr:hypothetical protein [Maribacter sp.]|tara:strand:+ start:175 stop:390 length:216 start_codon:yes stop_codon:yes gene_type:complete